MRIIENIFNIWSVNVSQGLPSFNEPDETEVVLDYLRSNAEQRDLLERILR